MFDLFKKSKLIIDKLYPVAKDLVADGDVDKMVKIRLNQLSQSYSYNLLNENRDPIDYSKTTTHIAYAYRSLASHADWLYKALRMVENRAVKNLQSEFPLVSCIGGGPGTDILGVMKFVHEIGTDKEKIGFYILDNQKGWTPCRKELIKTLPSTPKVKQKFVHFDATKIDSWVSNWDFARAKIFTFSFSLSELWAFNGNGCLSGFLEELISRAKKGSIFCCVDNGGENFLPLLTGEFAKYDELKLVASQDENRMYVSFDEQCNTLKEAYQSSFGQMPKLTGNVSIRVWKKV